MPHAAQLQSKPELLKLLKELQEFARNLVNEAGGSPPIGGTVDNTGQIGLVVDESYLAGKSSEDAVGKLIDSLKTQAAEAKIQAAGIAYMATVGNDTASQSHAIVTSLHHRSGILVDVVLPYSQDSTGSVSFGEQFVQEGNLKLIGT